MLDKAAFFHKNLISERSGFDTAHLEAENRRLSIELAIAREQEKVAQERAIEMAKANAAMRRSIDLLAREPDLTAFLGHVLQAISEQFDVDAAQIFMYDAVQRTLQATVGLIDGEITFSPPYTYQFSVDTWAGWDVLLQATRPRPFKLEAEPHLFLPEYLEYHQSRGHRGIVCTLLRQDDQPLGFIGFATRQRERFSENELELVQSLAQQATLAIQLTRLAEEAKQVAIVQEQERAAQERSAELEKANESLQRSLNQLSQGRDLESFLGRVLQEALRVLQGAAAQLFLYDPITHRISPSLGVDTQGMIRPEPGLVNGLPIGQPFPADVTQAWQQILEQRSPIFFDVEQDTELFWPGTIEFHRSRGERGSVCTALLLGDRPLGMLGLAFRERTEFTESEFAFFQALAQQATLAIHLTQLAEEAKQTAISREQEAAAQQRAAELAKANHALRRSIARLTTADSLQLFLNAVLKEAFQTSSGVNGAAVFDYEPASHTVQLLGLVISGEVIDIASDPRAEIYRSPIPSEAAGDWHIPDPERRIVWIDIDDPVLLHTPEAVLWHKQQGHQRLNVIPLFSGEQPLGFLGLAFTTRTPPSDAQIEHWWALAQHVGLALRLANLAEEAKQTAILDERNRMARDIHDTLAQSFTGIIMQLEALKSSPMHAPEETQAHLNRIRDIARLGLSEARRSVQALRPVAMETASFPDALRHLLNQMTQGTPVQTTLHIEGVAQSLPASVEENLLRIAQEAVTNAIRHGQAQTIALQLLFEPTAVHLQITDDGQGFAPATHLTSGFGLIGMQERVHHLGGHLHLVSQPGQGTEITVTIPSQG